MVHSSWRIFVSLVIPWHACQIPAIFFCAGCNQGTELNIQSILRSDWLSIAPLQSSRPIVEVVCR